MSDQDKQAKEVLEAILNLVQPEIIWPKEKKEAEGVLAAALRQAYQEGFRAGYIRGATYYDDRGVDDDEIARDAEEAAIEEDPK